MPYYNIVAFILAHNCKELGLDPEYWEQLQYLGFLMSVQDFLIPWIHIDSLDIFP